MADETPTPPEAPVYPAHNFPVIYVDGVLSAVWGSEFVKFYLARNDPDFKASTSVRQQTPFALVSMPVSGFLQTTTFFERILARMITEGTLTPEEVAAARAKHED